MTKVILQTSTGSVEATRGTGLTLNISTVAPRNLGALHPFSVSWPDFAARLLTTTTPAPEKNIGGYVGSRFRDKTRAKKSVIDAQVVSLDFDSGVNLPEVWGAFELLEIAGLVYTTHSHTAAKNRFRIVFPLSRPVEAAEYSAVARKVVRLLGSPNVDEGSYQAERLFFWPATPEGGAFISDYADGDVLDPDKVLESAEASTPNARKVHALEPEDPTHKKGVIGAFCRVYPIAEAIEVFLSGEYEQCNDRRGCYYTYLRGSTSGGLFVYPSGLHAYSHHSTDPANTGHAVNAFDLVRLHRFGELDKGIKPGTPLTGSPSFKAMRELAAELPEIKKEMNQERRDKAAKDYDEADKVRCSKSHQNILPELLEQIGWVDFRGKAELKEDAKVPRKIHATIAVDQLAEVAEANNWGLCTKHGFIYAYNGQYWRVIDPGDFKQFLAQAAIKMGVPVLEAKYHQFKDEIYKQFLSEANLHAPEGGQSTLINLANGTFEISEARQGLREARREDFIKHVLPFGYDPDAACPKFDAFIKEVVPDEACREVLAEFIGYIFARDLKLEKLLMLYGSGANGKSVFFDIIRALLGSENVCSYSLADLTRPDSWQRAELGNNLLNYTTEIGVKLENSIFKQLVSGEPVGAQRKYQDPFTMENYARLMVNGNVLPRASELTHAFFRRFLIVPFNVTIPKDQQNPDLAKEIIADELSGVFNWVLGGLRRLLKNRRFTESQVIQEQIEAYRKESDSVALFMDDGGYAPNAKTRQPLKQVYDEYVSYCYDNGNKPVSNREMRKRLSVAGYQSEKRKTGVVIYAAKSE